jgi:Flp pilus assembly protein TadD
MKRKTHFTILFSGTILVLLIILSITCSRKKGTGGDHDQVSEPVVQMHFVGRERCKSCHEKQYDLYKGSDHDMAMDEANDTTVLGDFYNASLTQGGITSRFFMKDGKYFVNTEGPDGELSDFEIKYTFGIRPLQQYIVEFTGGRYQMLPLCWDTRPASEGGQKWFHIYGQERIKPDDILFWTHIIQNWNYMCSECHSTHVRKQFDMASNSYNTVWDEIDVSCEACHGPGSRHIEWAELVEQGGDPGSYTNMGLAIRLKDTDNATWIFDMKTGTAKRSVNRQGDVLVEMCGRCHSRRSVATEDYTYGNHLLETHWPSVLEEGLYFPDGQILEEVYVYASFLQSKMYHSDVNCKDCHEPHSGKVFVHGNALCYRCHLAEKYGSREHHFHDPEQEGSNCFDCHMPERTYMVIDPRRDHSIRIPRPDLSDKLKTPNACIHCHDDKTNRWAAQYLEEWYGTVEEGKVHYGETFWAGRQAYPEALPELIKLVVDTALAPMIRGTAINLLQNYQDPSIIHTLSKVIQDPDPLVRFQAVNTLSVADQNTIADLVPPRLNDTIRLIRILAARVLTLIPENYLSPTTQRIMRGSLEEYIQSQMINADHPSAHMNLGVMNLNRGELGLAEASYKKANEIEPGYVTSYINLADLYRMQGRDAEGEKVLRNALESYPDMAAVHYALGLLLVRKKQIDEALLHLQRAAEGEPENSRFCYVYGVALHSTGKVDQALEYLESVLRDHPYDRDILYSLATMFREKGNLDKANEFADRLTEYYPGDPNYKQLRQSLK